MDTGLWTMVYGLKVVEITQLAFGELCKLGGGGKSGGNSKRGVTGGPRPKTTLKCHWFCWSRGHVLLVTRHFMDQSYQKTQ